MPSPAITHVVFDFDGIMVDTERLYTKANEETLAQFGGRFTKELKVLMMGTEKSKAVQKMLEACGLGEGVTVKQYLEVYEERLEKLMKKTEPLPGADKLIRHFSAAKIPLGICTGSDAQEFAQKTAFPIAREWLNIIPERVRVLCGSDPDVSEGKPSPVPYRVMIERLKEVYSAVPGPNKPENVLVFEDSTNGVRSALGAGCTVVMVPQRDQLPHDWPEAELRKQKNLADILDTLEAFKPEDYGLPALTTQIAN